MAKSSTLMQQSAIPTWDRSADVVIVGYGIAGACAALEAHRVGAEVMMVERASGGGGTSALSSGLFYLGGGTALQNACGVLDDPQSMYRFLLASTSVSDPELLRTFTDRSVEHFDWLEAQGIPFERSYYRGKSMCPASTDGQRSNLALSRYCSAGRPWTPSGAWRGQCGLPCDGATACSLR